MDTAKRERERLVDKDHQCFCGWGEFSFAKGVMLLRYVGDHSRICAFAFLDIYIYIFIIYMFLFFLPLEEMFNNKKKKNMSQICTLCLFDWKAY